MKAIQLLFLLSFTPFIVSEPCADFIEKMYQRKMNNDYSNLAQEESYFLNYSATNSYIPDFGNKTLCDEAPGMKYFFTIRAARIFHYETRSSAGYGVCLPVSCSSTPGRSQNQTLINTLFLARDLPALGGADIDAVYRLEDPNNWDKPLFYYPAILLFTLFAGVTIYSTIYLYQQKRKDQNSTNFQSIAEKPRFQWLMEAFDLKKNGLSLYQTAKEQGTSEDLAIFMFLRTCSAYWIIHFHTGLFNKMFCVRWWDDPKYLAFANSPLVWLESTDGVENFFFMGGFFAIYAMVAKLASAPFGVKAFLEQVKHRILRIWPVYMILLLLYSQIGPYIWSGPGLYLYQSEAYPCYSKLEILAKIFFLDGILNRFITWYSTGLCWGSTWYIAIEFHIYWFAILVVGVYAKYRRTGRALIIALIFQSIMFAQTRYEVYDHFQGEYAHLWEAKHIRTPCMMWYNFFIGALWGSLYYEYSKMKRKNIFTIFEKYPIVSYISMAFGLVLSIDVREHYFYSWYQFPFLVYQVIRPVAYAVSVSMIYMPLIANRSYLIKKIMNLRFFQITGKTSFVVYLLHDFVFRSVLMTTSELRTFDYLVFTRYALTAIFVAQMLGFWIHLSIEKPLTNIEMHFTKKKRAPAPKKSQIGFVELVEEDTGSGKAGR